MIKTDQYGQVFKETEDVDENIMVLDYNCSRCSYDGHGFVLMDQLVTTKCHDPVKELVECPKCEHKSLLI